MNHSTSDQAKKKDGSRATINFSTSPQPLFHKNFDLLSKTLRDYLLQGYKLYIFADSENADYTFEGYLRFIVRHKCLT